MKVNKVVDMLVVVQRQVLGETEQTTVEVPQLQLSWGRPVLGQGVCMSVCVQRQCLVETVLKTVEVRSCSSATRWPSSVYGGLAVGEGFFRRFYRRFSHSVRMDVECRLSG